MAGNWACREKKAHKVIPWTSASPPLMFCDHLSTTEDSQHTSTVWRLSLPYSLQERFPIWATNLPSLKSTNKNNQPNQTKIWPCGWASTFPLHSNPFSGLTFVFSFHFFVRWMGLTRLCLVVFLNGSSSGLSHSLCSLMKVPSPDNPVILYLFISSLTSVPQTCKHSILKAAVLRGRSPDRQH